MSGRRRRMLLLVTAAVVVTGIGAYIAARLFTPAATRSLTTEDAAAALHSAGVRHVAVQRVLGGAVVAPAGWKEAHGWLDPLYLVWLPSASGAKATYDRGYSPEALASQAAEARAHPRLYRGVLPRGFPKGVTTERVCNVIVVANNPAAAAVQAVASDRAIRELRAKCG